MVAQARQMRPGINREFNESRLKVCGLSSRVWGSEFRGFGV